MRSSIGALLNSACHYERSAYFWRTLEVRWGGGFLDGNAPLRNVLVALI